MATAIVRNLKIIISKNIFFRVFLFSLAYAISLCPYKETPNEPNKVKYVTMEIVKL